MLAVVLLLCGAQALPAQVATPARAETSPHLEPFAPYLGKTWKALVNPDDVAYDVSRWELILGGQAIRMRHSVNDGAYGGETIVVWDAGRDSLVYYYFTTAGFYTQGTMAFDGEGRLHTQEKVSGQAGGVSEVRSTQEILPDGRLKVETTMLRSGSWSEPTVVHYEEDPAAEIVLP